MLPDQSGSFLRSTKRPSSEYIGTSSYAAFDGNRRYLAKTQPRAEGWAIARLGRQGYQVFCPRYRKTVRHARKAKSVLARFFPNNQLLHLDTARDLWRAVNGTRGIVRLISQSETPAPLPYEIVECLLAEADAGGVMDWTPTFKIGQAVHIASGPFMNLVGKLERLDAAGRVRVLLELLGRKISVTLWCEAPMVAA